MDIVIIGLLLGGTYALMAMGLQLQYGVARIMNLANGEILIAGAFSTFWFYSATKASPLLALFLCRTGSLCLELGDLPHSHLPLVRRAKSQGKLEVDSILATFGISFISVGVLLAIFGGQYLDYSYLSRADFHFRRALRSQPRGRFLASAALCAASICGCIRRAQGSRCGPFPSTRRPPGWSRSTSRKPRRSPLRWAGR